MSFSSVFWSNLRWHELELVKQLKEDAVSEGDLLRLALQEETKLLEDARSRVKYFVLFLRWVMQEDTFSKRKLVASRTRAFVPQCASYTIRISRNGMRIV